MGQKPDPSYDPESRDPRCYYSRQERMALPNAPKPVKKNKKRIVIIILLDILLLFFAWQCIFEMRKDSSRQRNEVEILRSEYHYKAVFEKAHTGYEVKLLIRMTNDKAFSMPTNAMAHMTIISGGTTNSASIPSDGVSSRDRSIFSGRLSRASASGRVIVRFQGLHDPGCHPEFGK